MIIVIYGHDDNINNVIVTSHSSSNKNDDDSNNDYGSRLLGSFLRSGPGTVGKIMAFWCLVTGCEPSCSVCKSNSLQFWRFWDL